MSKKYKCDFEGCNKSYTQQGHLTVHKRTHTGEKSFKCDFEGCDYSSYTKGHVKAHKKTHTGEKPFKCDFEGCLLTFRVSTHLRDHKLRHTGKKPFECEFCNKKFVLNSDLTTHKRTHTGEKPFKCDFEGCDYSAKTSNALQVHKRTHTGEKPFKCDYENCDYSCAVISNLDQHKRTHTGEKPFKCDFEGCNYSASKKCHLISHKLIHTNEKPFKCDFEGCDYSCRQNSNLKSHIKAIHSEEGVRQQKKSENKTFKELEKIFELKREHRIDFSCNKGGTWCSIDGLIVKNGIIFCIENDENQHTWQLLSCETRRMADVKSVFVETGQDMPVVFIRFNPDCYRIDNIIQKIPFKTRIKEMIDLIEKISLKKDKIMPLNIVYLYYNKTNNILDIFYDIDYPEELKKCNLIL